jgi:predicted DNA-binding transcriptional regulator AlpA
MGRFTFWRDMKHDWVKIPLMAKELGVSVKTVYNWISVGKLFMPRPGYVSQVEAYEVWIEQKFLKSIHSHFMAAQAVDRSSNGKFKSKKEDQ